jgi:hypothetical protein
VLTRPSLESGRAEARMLGEHLPRSAVSVTRDAGTSFWVPLGTTWREFEARSSAKRPSELRRDRKRAETAGEVRSEAVSADEGNVDRYLQEF